MGDALRVLFIAAEAAPLAKVGGLGDVAGSLPQSLRALPEQPDVRLVLPFHGVIDREKFDLKPVAAFDIAHADGPMRAEIFETNVDGLPVYLVAGTPILKDASIYHADASMDGIKYTFFSIAALQMCEAINWQPDVIHAHDWHAAVSVYALAGRHRSEAFWSQTGSVLTVHNMPYMGNGAESAVPQFGLSPPIESGLPEWAQSMPLPLGIFAADKVTTVSPGYAEEILTPQFGAGMQDYLVANKNKLSGILNGLTPEDWDSGTDLEIPQNFEARSIAKRKENKIQLQAELSLPVNTSIPLLAIISRMDAQKGIDSAIEALRKIPELPWRVVILGTGDPAIEEQARKFARDYPNKVRAIIRFDGALARRIYAGTDVILLPSRYEPCGLAQMIAMRYGCLPLARSVGGLKDTIVDFDLNPEGATGFLYKDDSAEALANAIRRALSLYTSRQMWRSMQKRAMAQDFSWKRSAQKYYSLYESVTDQYHTV